MSTINSIAKNMIGGKNEQEVRSKYQGQILAGLFKMDEYLKHRTHRRDLGLEPIPRHRRKRARKPETEAT